MANGSEVRLRSDHAPCIDAGGAPSATLAAGMQGKYDDVMINSVTSIAP
jgi:hypothetical protein